ncbi:uncharacterized protein DUF1217 [Litoreibacter ponti]|uniref:Uncharacterized protein DUF1217 n=1 Tax=Litoreibacter ponti TaxID=1510457 RepID=A0A2T6BNC2_9RHOB|nr:DUF1217 domain-containing protein [Litoreibacter ponti]PTX57580.1 uncharacterized protein DUF1217 [Litoreibacter ponti]
MTFSPVIPFSGLQGWQFLSSTLERQKAAQVQGESFQRDTEYFAEKISSVRSADDLIEDRRLLSVALTAFGLEGDIENKFLIKKVLEDGSLKPDALANRFTDKRYLELTQAFGFGDFDTPNTVLSEFPSDILNLYNERSFEVAVGEQDETMRLALTLELELSKIAASESNERSKWYLVLGNPPLKQVFETALGLGSGFGSLDIDRQAEELRERSKKIIGVEEFASFEQGEVVDKFRNLFLLRTEVQNASNLSSQNIALALLGS